MAIRCVETGKVWLYAKDAAAALGISPVAITHCLKGRQKTAGGYSWVRERSVHPAPRRYTVRRRIHDDWGNVYRGYSNLAKNKGITRQKARALVTRSPDGVFRNEWLTVERNTIDAEYRAGEWVIAGRRFTSRNEAVKFARQQIDCCSVTKLHSFLHHVSTTGKATLRYGRRGWTLYHNDLFGALV